MSANPNLTVWLAIHGLARYRDLLAEHQVDLDVLPALSEQELEKLGIPLGDRKRLLQAIAKLDGQNHGEAISPPLTLAAPATTAESPAGERRQLTVMFCDLVGSTALSEKLDPEELRSLLHDYRMRCAEVIKRYEGFVARYVVDGILTYFGWPNAHEEDAERSVRAALEIVQVMKGMLFAEPLSVRIGIATGPVVVGEQAGEGDQAKLAVGSTPNLAARLQGLASADQIVIAPSTRRLVGNSFELSDLGKHELKGIADPVHAWRVQSASAAEGRFEATRGGAALTPFVGRDETKFLPWALHARGMTKLLDPNAATGAAEHCFNTTITDARTLGVRLIELRAANSLAALWQSQGKRNEARELLTPIYGWFTEGFDTQHLKDAKALLNRLLD